MELTQEIQDLIKGADGLLLVLSTIKDGVITTSTSMQNFPETSITDTLSNVKIAIAEVKTSMTVKESNVATSYPPK